jgi:hypothetical protein
MKRKNKRIAKSRLSPKRVQEFVENVLGQDFHAKRVRSVSDATLGVLNAGALGVHAIGRGLAVARGLADKHAIKQVDRLLSNQGLSLDAVFAQWVPYIVGERAEIVVNLDWTEFDKDGHSMLVASLQSTHGRATPLLWSTVPKADLKGNRNAFEDRLLVRLRELVDETVNVTIVADRGFGDQKLFEFLEVELGFGYIIRFRADIYVENAKGERRMARDWAGPGGRLRVIRDAVITTDRTSVNSVVVVQDRGMKDLWCLACSNATAKGSEFKKMYGKCFTCEELFRDMKDMRFGLGMSWNKVGKPERRDRMFLMAAFAHALLTLLGEAGERAGLDRPLKANTRKTRTISLFKQSLRWYELMPNMPDERLKLLVDSFEEVVAEHAIWQSVLGTL